MPIERRKKKRKKLYKLQSQETRISPTTSLPPSHRARPMLPSVPSLSIFHKDDNEPDHPHHQGLDRTVTIGDVIEEGSTSGEFSFGRKGSSIGGLVEEEEEEHEESGVNVGDEEEQVGEKEPASPPMYLGTGFGITWDEMVSGGGGVPEFDGVGDEEDFYRRMVGEYPCHPLLLSHYAQLLQSKGDFHGADEFYHRATLADPENGKIMLQHAKLVWEVHRDQHRALQIFKRAAKVAPADSQILGAYASFVWEIDDDDNAEEDMPEQDQIQAGNEETLSMYEKSTSRDDFKPFNPPTTSVEPEDGNVEEYYKKMLEENPLNQSVLKNYARFLVQNKQDRQGAEEYYARAVVADPKDGEIMSEYANMLWELHRDQEKASHFHEKAAESAPQNSYVLASYASFLWETEDDQVDIINQDQPPAST